MRDSSAVRRRSAEASGSSGRRSRWSSSSSCSMFDMSAPAFASTIPWRVSTMRTPGTARSTSTDSPRTASMARGSLSTRAASTFAPRRWHDVVEPHDAPLRLRHDLLRNHHHVAIPQRFTRPGDRLREEGTEIVSGSDPRNAGNRPNPQLPGSHSVRPDARTRGAARSSRETPAASPPALIPAEVVTGRLAPRQGAHVPPRARLKATVPALERPTSPARARTLSRLRASRLP